MYKRKFAMINEFNQINSIGYYVVGIFAHYIYINKFSLLKNGD